MGSVSGPGVNYGASNFGYVIYVNDGAHASPGGDLTSEVVSGSGPWEQVVLGGTPVAGDPTVATINNTDFPGMVHYPQLGVYWLSILVQTDGEVPTVYYDGRILPSQNESGAPSTFIANKLILGSPEAGDNELVFGTEEPTNLVFAGVQIVRIA